MKLFLKSVFFLTISLFTLGFTTLNQVKKIKLEVTPDELSMIYSALGKLPAEQSESLRNYIVIEFNKQTDTTKNKK